MKFSSGENRPNRFADVKKGGKKKKKPDAILAEKNKEKKGKTESIHPTKKKKKRRWRTGKDAARLFSILAAKRLGKLSI